MGKIITIGRQFGSGGREFGKRLSDELGYRYIDKEIICEIAKETSLSEGYVSNIIENSPESVYSISYARTLSFGDNYYLNQMRSVYSAQNDIINKFAQRENCVIIGRCADYILRNMNPYRIFVYASIESRVARCINRAENSENINLNELRKNINNVDKNRSRYYEFYTGMEWGNIENYDLCINTSGRIIKDLVPVVAKMLV